MVQTQVSTAYIAASANRFNHAAHVSQSSTLVAFGTGRLIAFWDVDDKSDNSVYETLPGHEGLVTCVRFLRNDLLASADDKGQVKLWQKLEKWRNTVTVHAHSRPISAISGSGGLLVTGSSDSSVKIWTIIDEQDTPKVEMVQVISLQGKYPLALSVTTLPRSQATILAIAGTDRNVHIWTRSDSNFVRSVALPGHEDWVRALAFCSPTPSTGSPSSDQLILASGSQDGTIRLWNISALESPQVAKNQSGGNGRMGALSDDLLDAFEASLADPTEGEEGGRQISLKRHILTVKSKDLGVQQYATTFDALLIGHEAGVTSLAWAPSTSPLQTLLSSSTDSSLILWSPSQILHPTSSNDVTAGSIWINRQRFGDVGGQRLGGFIGGLWARTTQGDEVIGWGWNGGWRRWQSVQTDPDTTLWKEIGAISGHSGPVKDLDWSPAGDYIISVGLDQTTRIHGAVSSSTSRPSGVWHELARPQVHGYDLVGATWLGPWTFASVADEKVARVFEAPRGFVETVKALGVRGVVESTDKRPIAAHVPPLGLSNKAISETPVQLDSSGLERRPFEGELAATTLWPEVEKVFGHGYEVTMDISLFEEVLNTLSEQSITVASSNSHDLLATACKATSAQHAVVRVYSTSTYQPFGSPLEGHSLTVTRIAFSPDDRYIVTVSRDRTWRAFEKRDDGYFPVAADKSHARIIWDCAWSREGDVFATASRDKTVKIWSPKADSDHWPTLVTLKFTEAATAVAFCSLGATRRLLAVGLETGEISIYSNLIAASGKWEVTSSIPIGYDLFTPTSLRAGLNFDYRVAHVDQIHRLAWQSTDEPTERRLASCSEDGTLKILVVQVDV
ncbi:WD40-repeat-containing domain protein [Boletus coccyginus]|nr:WD40-repeat-containing domain protein [Boletus coccyginus]